MPAIANAERPMFRVSAVGLTSAALRYAAATLWALLWLAGLFLAVRRVSGALVAPLDSLPLLLTAVAAAAMAAAGRWCWQASRDFSAAARQAAPENFAASALASRTVEYFVRSGSAGSLILLGLALWLPGVSLPAMAGFFAIVIVEEIGSLRFSPFRNATNALSSGATSDLEKPADFVPNVVELPLAPAENEQAAPAAGGSPLAGPHFLPSRPAPPLPPGKCDPPHREPASPHFQLPPQPSADESFDDGQLVQQLTRTATAAGSDRLHAVLFAQLPAGSRTASVHAAFCPPFLSLPQLAYQQASGPAARIKLAQLLVHGVRFDVKLAAAALESETVCIEMTASLEPLADDAEPGGAS